MKILLSCAGGFSTTVLKENMKKVIETSEKLNIEDFEIEAVPVDSLEAHISGTDVLLVGPQVEHRLDSILPIIEPLNIPYVLLDRDTYGSMDGAKTLKLALIAKRKQELKDEK